jgi:6-pyruvoyltetrahydropterin/6-carboxytetrahydropterin synthase
MVVDFLQLKDIVKSEVLNLLDHAYINDVIPQPTAENISEWIFKRLASKVGGSYYELYEVAVWETPTSFVRYRERDVW